MRQLTIKRKKSFIASLAKIFVYLETNEEIDSKIINGRLFKQVGSITNGNEISINISNVRTKLLIAYSKIMPEHFHVTYVIDEGDKNVILYTKPKFSPSQGNPFTISESE